MLVLQWEYLLGSAVASQWNDRQSPEWPPHPDRVFQALVAAWGGTGCQQGGAAALRWLESQPAPGMCVEHISPADTRIRKEHLIPKARISAFCLRNAPKSLAVFRPSPWTA